MNKSVHFIKDEKNSATPIYLRSLTAFCDGNENGISDFCIALQADWKCSQKYCVHVIFTFLVKILKYLR